MEQRIAQPALAKATAVSISGLAQANNAAYDPRFRRLIGQEGWASLPDAVRRRFSKRVEGERVVIYPGVIRQARFSKLGWIFAQMCRIVGAPLPLERECSMPAAVCVTEDSQGAGQFWTRTYARKNGFPQVIHSAKRFAGSTGLEEHIRVGAFLGIGMALRVSAIEGGIEFHSDHYFAKLLGRRVRLPQWLSPGETQVKHVDAGAGRFVFSLKLTHKWLGELVYQEGLFHDA